MKVVAVVDIGNNKDNFVRLTQLKKNIWKKKSEYNRIYRRAKNRNGIY